jgi:hypothetical protein
MVKLFTRPILLGLGVLLAVIVHHHAEATCGASFCMVNTNWNLQGFAPEAGLRADIRYEYIKQDQPMSGSDRVGFGQIPRHHDEIKSTSRNWLAGLDYTFNPAWGVSATIPVVDRSHSHIHNHQNEKLLETWSFTEMGDVRVLGRRQWMTEQQGANALNYYGVNFGLKLPTGERDIKNAAGDRAERTLQPGTGTTDIILGGYYSRALPLSGSSWFVQGLWQSALKSREDYKPGDRVTMDAGYRYELGDAFGIMLQFNALKRWRDSGQQAEPDNTGGTFFFISPGISYALTKTAQIYGFVQVPIYQYVNGVQLTADWSAVVGISAKF